MASSGVLVIDKPRGPTSHDVVSATRRVLGMREVGHAGTLDPMATGVLVVAFGEATKLVGYLTAHDKAYRATLRFGIATRSLDAEGEVIEERDVPQFLVDSLASLEVASAAPTIVAAIAHEHARTSQVPPNVSAIKVDGVAAYARERRGEVIEMEPRAVVVHALSIVGARGTPPEIEVEIACGKGYYVRSFARDFASNLGTVAHLTALRRTASGPFAIADAVDGDRLMRARRGDVELRDHLLTRAIDLVDAARRAMPSITLSDDASARAQQGKRIAPRDVVAGEVVVDLPCAWLSIDRRLVALGRFERVADAAVEAGTEGAIVGRVMRGFVHDAAAEARDLG